MAFAEHIVGIEQIVMLLLSRKLLGSVFRKEWFRRHTICFPGIHRDYFVLRIS